MEPLRFVQELIPLIHVNSSFDPTSAACYDFNKSTNACSPTNVSNCQRCQILIDRWPSSSLQSCASCPRYSSKGNLVMRTITFVLNSRTKLADHAQLDCQLHGCNSLENVNRIYRASKITFDFAEFFRNSSSNTI